MTYIFANNFNNLRNFVDESFSHGHRTFGFFMADLFIVFNCSSFVFGQKDVLHESFCNYKIAMGVHHSSLSLDDTVRPFIVIRFCTWCWSILYIIYVYFVYMCWPAYNMHSVSIIYVQHAVCLSNFPFNDSFAVENFVDLWLRDVLVVYSSKSDTIEISNCFFSIYQQFKWVNMKGSWGKNYEIQTKKII